MRHYSAFLVRHWSLAGGAARIEVQHIQSGEYTTVASLQEAAEWIGTQGLDLPPEPLPDQSEVADPPDMTPVRSPRAAEADPV